MPVSGAKLVIPAKPGISLLFVFFVMPADPKGREILTFVRMTKKPRNREWASFPAAAYPFLVAARSTGGSARRQTGNTALSVDPITPINWPWSKPGNALR